MYKVCAGPTPWLDRFKTPVTGEGQSDAQDLAEPRLLRAVWEAVATEFAMRPHREKFVHSDETPALLKLAMLGILSLGIVALASFTVTEAELGTPTILAVTAD